MSADAIARLIEVAHTLDLALRELLKVEALTTAAVLAWSHDETFDPEMLFELVRDLVTEQVYRQVAMAKTQIGEVCTGLSSPAAAP